MTRYDWKELYAKAGCCESCRLYQTRNNVVIGCGNADADVMLIGEGPGREEDLKGIPFVGAAGHLLDDMMEISGIKRGDVYIANIVKCRPPSNRTPFDDEAAACLPYLRAQVALVRPKIIVCLGRTAAKYVFGEDIRITKDRGVWRNVKGIWMIATYHPAALLRDESKYVDSLRDLKSVKAKLDEIKINAEI